jgi:hypothetical protein
MVRLFALLAASLALLPSATAAAQSCQAPPGTAAVDEYCETIPAAGGDRGSADPSRPVPISKQTAQELSGSRDGAALLRQLGNDPAKPRGSRRSGSDEPSRSSAAPPSAPSSNPLDAVGSALSSGPTLGGGFIAALLAVTLLMLTWGWITYRRRPGE